MYYSNGDIAYSNTDYILHGKNIVHLTQGSNELHFFYDAQNKPAVVDFNGTKYGYIVNLQGDVLGLIDSTGAEVVKYTYDAWGKVLSTTGSLASTLGTVQPFRYRGYVYDVETGLYYLRSRYYNPIWQRFHNADALVKGNLFAYCNSNPTLFYDDSGLEKRRTCVNCEYGMTNNHYSVGSSEEFDTEKYPLIATPLKESVYVTTTNTHHTWQLDEDHKLLIGVEKKNDIYFLKALLVTGTHYAAPVNVDYTMVFAKSAVTGTIKSKDEGRAGLVNVRNISSLGSEKSIIATLEKGTIVDVLGKCPSPDGEPTWYLISGDFGIGFVYSNYLEINYPEHGQ